MGSDQAQSAWDNHAFFGAITAKHLQLWIASSHDTRVPDFLCGMTCAYRGRFGVAGLENVSLHPLSLSRGAFVSLLDSARGARPPGSRDHSAKLPHELEGNWEM